MEDDSEHFHCIWYLVSSGLVQGFTCIYRKCSNNVRDFVTNYHAIFFFSESWPQMERRYIQLYQKDFRSQTKGRTGPTSTADLRCHSSTLWAHNCQQSITLGSRNGTRLSRGLPGWSLTPTLSIRVNV